MQSESFIYQMKRLKAEVLAMKQGYRYGVGRADFSSASISASGTKTIVVNFTTPPEKMPMVQVYGFTPTSAPTYTNGVYSISGNAGGSMKVVASSPISSVEAV